MKFTKNIGKQVRNKRGSIAVELAAGALVSIGIMALALNVCFAMLAYGTNDRACREAARAAAQQTSLGAADNIARFVLQGFTRENSYLGAFQLVSVKFNDFGGNPPDNQSPFVTVTTKTTVNMPAPIEFYGNRIFPPNIPVQKTYTFPIVKMNVNTQNG